MVSRIERILAISYTHTFSVEENDHLVTRQGHPTGADFGHERFRMSARGKQFLARVVHEIVDKIILLTEAEDERLADPCHRLRVEYGKEEEGRSEMRKFPSP